MPMMCKKTEGNKRQATLDAFVRHHRKWQRLQMWLAQDEAVVWSTATWEGPAKLVFEQRYGETRLMKVEGPTAEPETPGRNGYESEEE